MRRRDLLVAAALLPVALQAGAIELGQGESESDPPFDAQGERVGEVTDSSALLHTRLTAHAVRNNDGYLFPQAHHGMRPEELKAIPMPNGMTIAELHGDCPGKAGRVRAFYGTDPELKRAKTTEWATAGPETDFTHKFELKNLESDTRYYYSFQMAAVKGNKTRRTEVGQFLTAPAAGKWRKLKFTIVTCQDYVCRDLRKEGFRTYRSMRAMAPDFFVHTGDNVYYDTETPLVTSVELARHHWHRMYSLPTMVDFFRNSSAYWQKDDHDSFEDDDWRTREPHRVEPMTYNDLAPIFTEQVPVGPVPYRTFRWGKGVQIWLTEGRDFRSPNGDPDGPNKTFWGKEQKVWFKRTILESDAQFRIVINPTPLIGPDEPGRDYFKFPGGNGDNMTDLSYATEGNEIRQFLGGLKEKNLYLVTGDRHWQYFSVDPDTKLHEFSVGPVCDTHTVKPFPTNPRYHRFLRFAGGFLSISLDGSESRPVLTFRLHDVDGKVLLEHVAGS